MKNTTHNNTESMKRAIILMYYFLGRSITAKELKELKDIITDLSTKEPEE